MKRIMAFVFVATAALVACSSDDSGSTSSSSSSGSSSATASGLSAAFGSNCAGCHGPKGEGGGAFPRIPGSQTEAGFIARVRSGKGVMPAFSASQISDADLKADYLWLTTQR